MDRTNIRKIWIGDDAVWIETNDGQIGFEFLADYLRLYNADRTALQNYTLSFYGIHWPELDEDLSFDGFFAKAASRQMTAKQDAGVS